MSHYYTYNVVLALITEGQWWESDSTPELAKDKHANAPINCAPDQPLYGNGWGLGGVLTRVDSEISPGGAGK